MFDYNKIKDFTRAVDSFLDKLTPKFSYESFLEFLSDYFDEIIIDTCRKENCTYVSGTCIISVDTDYVNVKTELYYAVGQVYNKHVLQGAVELKKFTMLSREQQLKQIATTGGIKITVNAPGEERC